MSNLTEAQRWLQQAQYDVYTSAQAADAVAIAQSLIDAITRTL